jgi:hypothetical protein
MIIVFLAKELKFYSNHKTEIKEKMLLPKLQTIARVN